MADAPDISFCVATHHGRARELAVALDSVLSELDGDLAGRVEVCVSDNASRDDTAAIIEERQQRAPGVIRYRRNAVDLGASRNIVLAAGMARGDAIWLLSSDDALEPGAIHRVVAALRADDEIAGISIDRRLYGRDLVEPSAIVDAARPALTGVRRLGGREALDAFGLYATFISTQIIRTRVWQEASRSIGPTRLNGSIYPHVWVMVRAWLAGDPWLWEPRAIVRARLENFALVHPSHRSVDALLAQAVRDQRRLWSALVDRSDARRQLERFRLQVFPDGHRDTLAFHRLNNPTRVRRETFGLLVASLRAFWWSPGFWREALPALVLMLLGRTATEEQLAAAREAVVSARLDASCPVAGDRLTLDPGEVLRLAFRLSNAGPASLRSRPGAPLTVAAQWIDPGSGPVLQVSERAALPGRFSVGAQRDVTVAAVAPRQPGHYLLKVSALIEGVGVVENGAWTRPVDVRSVSAEQLA